MDYCTQTSLDGLSMRTLHEATGSPDVGLGEFASLFLALLVLLPAGDGGESRCGGRRPVAGWRYVWIGDVHGGAGARDWSRS